jgi:hypothetical protein
MMTAVTVSLFLFIFVTEVLIGSYPTHILSNVVRSVVLASAPTGWLSMLRIAETLQKSQMPRLAPVSLHRCLNHQYSPSLGWLKSTAISAISTKLPSVPASFSTKRVATTGITSPENWQSFVPDSVHPTLFSHSQ